MTNSADEERDAREREEQARHKAKKEEAQRADEVAKLRKELEDRRLDAERKSQKKNEEVTRLREEVEKRLEAERLAQERDEELAQLRKELEDERKKHGETANTDTNRANAESRQQVDDNDDDGKQESTKEAESEGEGEIGSKASLGDDDADNDDFDVTWAEVYKKIGRARSHIDSVLNHIGGTGYSGHSAEGENDDYSTSTVWGQDESQAGADASSTLQAQIAYDRAAAENGATRISNLRKRVQALSAQFSPSTSEAVDTLSAQLGEVENKLRDGSSEATPSTVPTTNSTKLFGPLPRGV